MNLKHILKSNTKGLIVSLIVVIILLLIGLTNSSSINFSNILTYLCVSFRGPITIFCYACVLFLIYFSFSKFGSIRIGGENAKPEYSTFSWLSCLFMAGLGIGIVYYSQEPVLHYFNNPYSDKLDQSPYIVAYSLSLFNWTINAWAQYAVLGLVMAYFFFNEGRSLKLSSIVPARFPQWVKSAIDIIMALGVIAGLTTSLGLGVSQMCSGLSYAFGYNISPYLLMGGIGMIAMFSILSGLKRGVKWLSNITILCATAFMLIVLAIGIFGQKITDFVPFIGEGILRLFTNYFTYNDFYNHTSDAWAASYPIFFDLWFASWASFVAVFVARISKGRTFREFIIGVVGLPILFTCIWFGIFGRLGFEFKDLIYETMNTDISTSIFIFIEQIVGHNSFLLMSAAILIIICLFFVTSSDSGSYVVASLLSSNKNIKSTEKIFWSIFQCLIAMILFYFGGLSLVQSASVVMGILVILLIFAGGTFFIYHIIKINRTK